MTALASPEPATASPPAAPRGPLHVLAPLVVALAAAAGVYALYRVFVRSTLGQLVDTAAMRGAQVSHPKIVQVLDRTLNGTSLAILVLVCLFAATVGVLRKRIDLAIGSAFMVIGANVSTQLLKTRLFRPELDGMPLPNSFPSGHTAAAASVAFALILVLPSAVRGTVALAGFGYVTVIAIATVWAEWHRPSDTVAGLLVVLAWGSVATFGIRLWRLRVPAGTSHTSRPTMLLLFAVGAVAGAIGLLGLGAAAMSQGVSPDLVSGRFTFLAGAACITGAVAGAFLVWLRLAAGDRPALADSSPSDV
jgi:membrane-associated phospholipid phosphatase